MTRDMHLHTAMRLCLERVGVLACGGMLSKKGQYQTPTQIIIWALLDVASAANCDETWETMRDSEL